MYQIKKRSGETERFELGKIRSAISRTFDACNRSYQDSIIELLAIKAIAASEKKVRDGVLSVEDIQDGVEATLMAYGYEDVAKAYIVYRKQHEKVRNAKETVLNYKKTMNDYLGASDWRVKENSTVTYSLGGLILGNSGAVTANYWLSEIYDDEISNAHRNCDFHIHDLSMLSPYCAGWSLKQLIKEGLGGVRGKIASKPAKHLFTLCNQMVNFLGILQNEWAGAQAFSSVDTYLAPFVKYEDLSYIEVKQCMESLIFGLNTPSRWGCQAPFTNFTFDWVVPDDLAELNCIVGGKEVDFKYKDCKREMDMINRAFMEVMIEGDANGRGFQYPIPTYSITKEFDWDTESINNKLLFEMTAKYGIPYFSNYINSDMKPSDIRSMCVLPDTMVWIKTGNRAKHIPIKDLYELCDEYDSVKILSKYGYRNIKEAQRFDYKGEMLRITTKGGKVLTITPDHMQVVYDVPKSLWYTKNGIKRKFKPDEDTSDWTLVDKGFKKNYKLIKKHGYELKVGDFLSCRNPNAGERRKGLTYEQFYGDDKARIIKEQFSVSHRGQEAWNKGLTVSQKTRRKISETLKGHPVTDNCREKSRERWVGENNPKHKEGSFHKGKINCTVSHFEYEFAKELEALGLEYIHQFIIETDERSYVPDFYIPEKNLLIELETNYRYADCSYNEFSKVLDDSRERYETLRKLGYNVLVFNPKVDNSSYRQYINSVDEIVSIEPIYYEGYVYDVEVDCDDIEENLADMYHTFYANEILTGNCCRLRLDLRELRRKNGGYFGSGESTGSVGVVTINMPRLAYKSRSEADFFTRLDSLMDIAARSLHVKRSVISQYLEQGLYPYTKRYLGNLSNHFSTLAVLGMNEACLNACWIKDTIASDEGYEFSKRVLDHMRERLSDYQELYPGELFNLESAPAESTTLRFALHDKKDFPDIITAGDNTEGSPYYTNSSHLPVNYTEDIFTALDHQDDLQIKYTSGTVFHAFLGEKLPNWQSAMNLTRKIAENYKLPYFTFSPTYSVCPEHGYIKGEEWTCPECGKKTEVYSRVTGYYRAVQNFNDGKAHEFKDRSEYVIKQEETKPEPLPQGIGCASCMVDVQETVVPEESLIPTKPMLFTTATCPNCKMAKKFIEEAGFDCDILLADENAELATQLGIKQAPTLVVVDQETGTPTLVGNVSNIRKYLESINK